MNIAAAFTNFCFDDGAFYLAMTYVAGSAATFEQSIQLTLETHTAFHKVSLN